jgi:hypothetical protein
MGMAMAMAGSPTPGLMQQAQHPQQAQAMGADASLVGRRASTVTQLSPAAERGSHTGPPARIAKRRASLRRRHRVFAANRAGRSRVACTDSRLACRMQPTHDVSCRPPGGTHVCCGCGCGLWPCAWCAVRLIELGPTRSARDVATSHLSTVDYRPSTLRRPTSPHGAAASSQQPVATPLICSRTPKMPHVVCGQRQGQTARETIVLDYPWHMPAGQRSPSTCG